METPATGCAAFPREEFGCPWVRLTLNKPGAVGAAVDEGASSSGEPRCLGLFARAIGVSPLTAAAATPLTLGSAS
ncbi:hypothetical protein [Candidatus Thiodictyon syntrophicum]|uniref:hypothetical protein n=1 Tax=Candidatus Thiodictyon syntrophicum TaxID=1166950 RepID=UPI001C12BE3C